MKKFIYIAGALVPSLALAQFDSGGTLQSIVDFIGRTVASLIPIMFGLAIVFFFWGLVKFIRAAGDPKAAAEGKSIMIYGVIAIAVMISIYGLADWLRNLFGINNISTVTPPTVGNLP